MRLSTISKEKAKEKIFYSYTHNINGFAAVLEEEEASSLSEHPDVISVLLNKARKLHTTHSWNFLGLEKDGVVPPSSLWKKARYGEGVIIGNLDTAFQDGFLTSSGVSLSQKSLPARKFYPLISGARAKVSNQSEEDANLCKPGTLDSRKVKGKILVCLRGVIPRVEKGHVALLAGAVGMILANDEDSGNDILADAHVLPAAHIISTDGEAVFSYLNSTKTVLGTKPAPSMASFSSRGPNILEGSILKPDITAPGVRVIAAFTLATGPTGEDYDKRRTAFNNESAIMTTATTRDNNGDPILDSPNTRATPFAYGAGHVQPNRAADPGLVYDLTVNDFLNYLCSRGYTAKDLKLFTDKPYNCPESFSLTDFNYPSISVVNLNDTITITRRVKNVSSPGKYYIHVGEPTGVLVSVEPDNLEFKKLGEEKTFKLTFKLAPKWKLSSDVFGILTWSDGKHFVRSPLVVRPY
ncbi:hypothetical protein OIU78_025463 [Salix suchowensis]|nr:hypothetical protein OIU78_025463 [Salix suchowensis]